MISLIKIEDQGILSKLLDPLAHDAFLDLLYNYLKESWGLTIMGELLINGDEFNSLFLE